MKTRNGHYSPPRDARVLFAPRRYVPPPESPRSLLGDVLVVIVVTLSLSCALASILFFPLVPPPAPKPLVEAPYFAHFALVMKEYWAFLSR